MNEEGFAFGAEYRYFDCKNAFVQILPSNLEEGSRFLPPVFARAFLKSFSLVFGRGRDSRLSTEGRPFWMTIDQGREWLNYMMNGRSLRKF